MVIFSFIESGITSLALFQQIGLANCLAHNKEVVRLFSRLTKFLVNATSNIEQVLYNVEVMIIYNVFEPNR